MILPELWLGPDDSLHGRYPAIIEWVRRRYARGAAVYSACSGAVMLAETGLLDGCEATSHWACADLFARQYPGVRFRPEPNLVFSEPGGRIVTAGGTTSWHDLALHVIARYGSPEEASRIARVYLLNWHGEAQLPYTPLLRDRPHGGALVRSCQDWLQAHFREAGVLQRAVERSAVSARTLKRRFKAATGLTLIDFVQNLRIEKARRLLETVHGHRRHQRGRRLRGRVLFPPAFQALDRPVAARLSPTVPPHPRRR